MDLKETLLESKKESIHEKQDKHAENVLNKVDGHFLNPWLVG